MERRGESKADATVDQNGVTLSQNRSAAFWRRIGPVRTREYETSSRNFGPSLFSLPPLVARSHQFIPHHRHRSCLMSPSGEARRPSLTEHHLSGPGSILFSLSGSGLVESERSQLEGRYHVRVSRDIVVGASRVEKRREITIIVQYTVFIIEPEH